MNLIYLRPGTPKARKFIRRKLRGGEARSIYDIEAGDCSLPPADTGGPGYMLTFLNDATPEMLAFIGRSAAWAALSRN